MKNKNIDLQKVIDMLQNLLKLNITLNILQFKGKLKKKPITSLIELLESTKLETKKLLL